MLESSQPLKTMVRLAQGHHIPERRKQYGLFQGHRMQRIIVMEGGHWSYRRARPEEQVEFSVEGGYRRRCPQDVAEFGAVQGARLQAWAARAAPLAVSWMLTCHQRHGPSCG